MATRWGICSAGKISTDFCTALVSLPAEDHKIAAVAARDKTRAAEFAAKYKIPVSYDSYEHLAANPDIDVVYIGSISNEHKKLCLLFLNAGKNVLCEKPVTMNRRDAQEVIDVAREKKCFFMEAIWSRCFPIYRKMQAMLATGELGDITLVQAEFGQNNAHIPRAREPALGAGTLIDMGIYPLQLANLFFKGPPKKIIAAGHLFPEGADRCSVVTLLYDNGAMAQLTSHSAQLLTNRASIYGTKGAIHIPDHCWCPTKLQLPDGEVKEYPLPSVPYPTLFDQSEGLIYEAQHVRECLQQGLLESPLVPQEDSLQLMGIMDECRRQLGVVYDADKE